MKVSIAMATYNGAAYLPQQLASFASQTRLPDELIVTDDCSSDATCAIVRSFAATAPFPVRLEINRENLGFVRNFDRALSLTAGDLVFLSDQDDVWFDTKLAHMVEFAGDHPDAACFMNDAMLADEALVPSGITKQQNIRTHGMPDTAFVMGCCTAVSRQFLEFILPIPPNMRAHDYWIIGAAELLGLVERTPATLQLYRRHADALSDMPVNKIGWGGVADRFLKQSKYLRNISSDRKLFDELDFYSALHAKLCRARDASGSYPPVSSERFDALSRRLAILKRRSAIRKMKFANRLAEVVRLLGEGAYSSKGGALVAAKDIVLSGPEGGNTKGVIW